jgi:hypothetical protein
MDPLTFEAASHNPELVRALMTQAHRERAEAVHRLIIEPIRSFFTRQLRGRQPAVRSPACG